MSFNRIQINILIIVFLLFTVSLNLYSQNIPFSLKNKFLTINRQIIEGTINKQTEIDYPFIVGRYHSPVANKINHPYFKNNEWVNGTLVYNGQSYVVEGLKYDIENDKLIYLVYTQNYIMNTVALDENFISEFNISDTTFKYYHGLKNNRGATLKNGYYEVVFDGNLKFLVRREKAESCDENSSLIKYNVTTEMFLLKNGRMIRVKAMSKLIKQLKDKKKEVKNFVWDNSLILNKSDYSSAFKILNYHETLQK